MAIVIDRELQPGRRFVALGELGWLGVAAGASLGAGAIHAAAVGAHSEHASAVVAFTVVATLQLGWGVLALTRPGKLLLALGALAHAGFFASWVLSKVSGIPFIDGLDVKEPLQAADTIAAGLAVVSVLGVLACLFGLGDRQRATRPRRLGAAAVFMAALAVPGMFLAGSHAHVDAHEDSHDDVHAAEQAPHVEDSAHAAGGEHLGAADVSPKPYDPTLPIDLSGVDGVTPQEQARAEKLLTITLVRLPRFADPLEAEALGFVSIGDGALGHEHYLNQANMNDDKILDPDFPESLVFDTSVTPKRLAAAMFMLQPGDTLADVPELGGKLTQWHIHDNLCFAGERVAGLTDAAGDCAPGLTKGAETPMIHVWIQPHPCGPFAALEGVAGGSVPVGEQRLCDHAHGA